MSETTDAEKAALIADAQAQAQHEPVPVPEEISVVGGPYQSEPMATQKIGPDMEAAPLMAGPATHAPTLTAEPGQAVVSEWGPYSDYQIINTGFGEFAVEVGYVLFFVQEDIFNSKAGQFVRTNVPCHRLASETQQEALDRIMRTTNARPVRA